MESDSFDAALRKAREIAAKMHINSKPAAGGKKSGGEKGSFESNKTLALKIANSLSRGIPKEIRVISQGLNREGEQIIHIMIPNILVCLFAGKNNETLASLQQRAGVRMEMDLESSYSTSVEKPLTVIGEPDKVEAAREMVNSYIREKDELLGINQNNMQLSLGIEYDELLIPKEAVGLVIGKQGENIKKVNNETGCTVKFKAPEHDSEKYRICMFQGTPTQIKKAKQEISELTEMLKRKFGLARPVPDPGQELEEVRISANRAGVVIGKGGENIKQINNLSGAQVCIDRSTPETSEYRTFFVVGTRQQVEHAKFLIREKSGEAGELPLNVIMKQCPSLLNPMLGITPWGAIPPEDMNQPVPPPPFNMMAPSEWYPPYENQHPMHAYPTQPMTSPQMVMPQNEDNQQPYDYSSAWASYYQQYYPDYNASQHPGTAPMSSVNSAGVAEGQQQPEMDAEAYNAYWQQYYQQLYAQNPEYYQQMVASYNQQQQGVADASTSQPPAQTVNQTAPQVESRVQAQSSQDASSLLQQGENQQAQTRDENPSPNSVEPMIESGGEIQETKCTNGSPSQEPLKNGQAAPESEQQHQHEVAGDTKHVTVEADVETSSHEPVKRRSSRSKRVDALETQNRADDDQGSTNPPDKRARRNKKNDY